MSFDDDVRIPEPRDELTPPERDPLTTEDADAPRPEPRPPTVVRREIRHWPPLLGRLDEAVERVLDFLDAAGDAVAKQLGLRQAGGGKPPASPPPAA